jgi:aldose sugar dehydrogenase
MHENRVKVVRSFFTFIVVVLFVVFGSSCGGRSTDSGPEPDRPVENDEEAGNRPPENEAPDDNGSDDNGSDGSVALRSDGTCRLIPSGFGASGGARINVETVVSGLVVPWGIAFLSSDEFLVTERPGRVRLVRNGRLESQSVIVLDDVAAGREGGLMGIALDPEFPERRFVYLYYTARKAGGEVNRVARYRLDADFRSAALDRVILDNIPSGLFHDGGRIRFGPDGRLYIGTGDGKIPRLSQDQSSLAGKILRVMPDGSIPDDNPDPGSPVYISGIRNLQAFDWLNDQTVVLADHGPSGEMGRRGHDELNIASGGDNLGWPDQWGCEEARNRVRPLLAWRQALPPGGLAYYTGSAIPEWRGSVLIATLSSRHLQRVELSVSGRRVSLERNEVYLQGQYGRLREVIQAPDGSLYVTTSNCDGRGACGPDQDRILKITGR